MNTVEYVSLKNLLERFCAEEGHDFRSVNSRLKIFQASGFEPHLMLGSKMKILIPSVLFFDLLEHLASQPLLDIRLPQFLIAYTQDSPEYLLLDLE